MNDRRELWAWLEKNAVYKPLPHLSGQQNLTRRHAELRLLREVKAILEKYPIPRSRKTDPKTSKGAARATKLKAGSQRHVLLCTYRDHPEGLTSEEAAESLGWIDSRIGYWKRVSELLSSGLIVDTGEKRVGRSGQEQRVCRITQHGVEALK